MQPIRVLVVDDSAVFRTTLSKVLESSSLVRTVSTAPDGKIGIQKLAAVPHDVVVLDVEMPGMDGIETLRKIKEKWPNQKVIMFSAHTQKGAAATIDALALGALDFVPKPSGKSLEENKKAIEELLIPKMEAIFSSGTPAPSRPVSRPVAPRPSPRIRTFRRDQPPIVAIGVSTGGPNALAELLPCFPKGFPSPVVITQHMPPLFTRQLANRLDQKSNLTVHEGEEGMELEAGHAYIAPGDYHMEIQEGAGTGRGRIHLHQGPPECSCRPAVDVMFRSIANTYGANTIAVILTGMGQDGFESSKLLKGCDAYIIAQDQASCVVYGMPSFIVNNGLADEVLPLNRIGKRIVQLVQG